MYLKPSKKKKILPSPLTPTLGLMLLKEYPHCLPHKDFRCQGGGYPVGPHPLRGEGGGMGKGLWEGNEQNVR